MNEGPNPDLVTDLLDPGNYPPPIPSEVGLITTHASWVFLTDREAWKVKRPVKFGFLDYSTLSRRLECCEREVDLNRRLAPDVYLGVVPVRRDARGFSFVRGADIADAAVRMRRLPDEASGQALLDDGRLTWDHLARLVDRLAPFYASAPERASFGAPDRVRSAAFENLNDARPLVGSILSDETFRTVGDYLEDFFHRHDRDLAGRMKPGRVRDGHGDLRLEHVYFLGDAPIVIDCVEFDDRFRCVDVAADVSFLAMDLEVRNRPDFAAWLMSRFARETGDYDFYPLLDFYLLHRAWVRGKIAGLMADDPGVGMETRKRKRDEAAAHFRLACRHATRPAEPRLVVVGGMIGIGKSTLAEALGRETSMVVIGSDRTRKFLAGIQPENHAGPAAYSEAMSDETYREMFRRAGQVLRSGRGVILDATFRLRRWRREAMEVARRHGAEFRFVEAACDPEELRRRLRSRSGKPSVSDAREDLLESFQKKYDPVDEVPERLHLRIDTSGSLDEALKELRDALAVGGLAHLPG